MTFEELGDLESAPEETEGPPPEESNNRTFLIVAGILGGLILLSLICIAVFAAIKIIPEQQKARQTQIADVNAQSTVMVRSMTETAMAPVTLAPTARALNPTFTPQPTQTERAEVAATATPLLNDGEAGGATSTPTETPTLPVSALKTQLYISQLTQVPTALPQTGFADEVGIPGLLAMAGVLLVIIFAARKLRNL
jgi:hypothetical protein